MTREWCGSWGFSNLGTFGTQFIESSWRLIAETDIGFSHMWSRILKNLVHWHSSGLLQIQGVLEDLQFLSTQLILSLQRKKNCLDHIPDEILKGHVLREQLLQFI